MSDPPKKLHFLPPCKCLLSGTVMKRDVTGTLYFIRQPWAFIWVKLIEPVQLPVGRYAYFVANVHSWNVGGRVAFFDAKSISRGQYLMCIKEINRVLSNPYEEQ